MGAPVVANQFSAPRTGRDGRLRGTRGATPSAFVLDYMARPDAAEKLSIEESSAAQAPTRDTSTRLRTSTLREPHATPTGGGGRVFTNRAIMLTDDEANVLARRFDDGFKRGGVLLKTVISLDHEYLVTHELVPRGTPPARKKGDYAGKVDQVRLREATARALDDLAKRGGFGDMLVAATVQTDTKHVHVHLAMMDLDPAAGRRVTTKAAELAARKPLKDRTLPPARGTIRANEREAVRRALDKHLDASRPRSLARTTAISRAMSPGAKLSPAARRLIAKRTGAGGGIAKTVHVQTPKPAEQSVVTPTMTAAQAYLLVTLHQRRDRRLVRAQLAAGHPVSEQRWDRVRLDETQARDLREVLDRIYVQGREPGASLERVDPLVWDLIAGEAETRALAQQAGYGASVEASTPFAGVENQAFEAAAAIARAREALDAAKDVQLERGGPEGPAL